MVLCVQQMYRTGELSDGTVAVEKGTLPESSHSPGLSLLLNTLGLHYDALGYHAPQCMVPCDAPPYLDSRWYNITCVGHKTNGIIWGIMRLIRRRSVIGFRDELHNWVFSVLFTALTSCSCTVLWTDISDEWTDWRRNESYDQRRKLRHTCWRNDSISSWLPMSHLPLHNALCQVSALLFTAHHKTWNYNSSILDIWTPFRIFK